MNLGKIKLSGRRLVVLIGIGILLVLVGICLSMLPSPRGNSPANTAPTILGITIKASQETGELVYDQIVNFYDEDGNTDRIERELLDLSDPSQRSYLQVTNSTVDVPPQVQKIRATVTDVWHCQGHIYKATLAVSLVDRDGNRSKPVRYVIDCK